MLLPLAVAMPGLVRAAHQHAVKQFAGNSQLGVSCPQDRGVAVLLNDDVDALTQPDFVEAANDVILAADGLDNVHLAAGRLVKEVCCDYRHGASLVVGCVDTGRLFVAAGGAGCN